PPPTIHHPPLAPALTLPGKTGNVRSVSEYYPAPGRSALGSLGVRLFPASPCIAWFGPFPDEIPWWVYLAAAVLAVGLAYLFRYRLFVRLPLWVLKHTLYRLRVYGLENLPAEGPALLVCNHVSHIDALFLLAAQKRRIRFIVWAPYLRIPGVRLLLRLANVIPIDSSSGPRAILQSLRAASDALARGELVCIFAEGGITRTGFLLPFHRGFEQVVKRSPAPVIPVCLDNVWGSIFSFQGGRFFW